MKFNCSKPQIVVMSWLFWIHFMHCATTIDHVNLIKIRIGYKTTSELGHSINFTPLPPRSFVELLCSSLWLFDLLSLLFWIIFTAVSSVVANPFKQWLLDNFLIKHLSDMMAIHKLREQIFGYFWLPLNTNTYLLNKFYAINLSLIRSFGSDTELITSQHFHY